MKRMNSKLACLTAFVMLVSAVFPASADEALRYGPRANRHEGVRAKPVSGFGVDQVA